MIEQNDNLRMISEIRTMMEQSSRFMSLSGLSGVIAGIAALSGAAVAWGYLDTSPFLPFVFDKLIVEGVLDPSILRFLFLDGLIIMLIALFFGLFFSYRKASRQGKLFWTRGARMMLINVSIPLFTGGAFISVLMYYHITFLVPATCLIFYGLALVNGSKFTLPDIRTLGLLEIALGLIACFLPGYGLLMWAIGFGLLHIIYGLTIRHKYERV